MPVEGLAAHWPTARHCCDPKQRVFRGARQSHRCERERAIVEKKCGPPIRFEFVLRRRAAALLQPA